MSTLCACMAVDEPTAALHMARVSHAGGGGGVGGERAAPATSSGDAPVGLGEAALARDGAAVVEHIDPGCDLAWVWDAQYPLGAGHQHWEHQEPRAPTSGRPQVVIMDQ